MKTRFTYVKSYYCVPCHREWTITTTDDVRRRAACPKCQLLYRPFAVETTAEVRLAS